jgi:hypothetical protein
VGQVQAQEEEDLGLEYEGPGGSKIGGVTRTDDRFRGSIDLTDFASAKRIR